MEKGSSTTVPDLAGVLCSDESNGDMSWQSNVASFLNSSSVY